MLFSVEFHVVMRKVWMLLVLRRKKFREKKAPFPLYLLLPCCGYVGFDSDG